jgi:hypothetical protein
VYCNVEKANGLKDVKRRKAKIQVEFVPVCQSDPHPIFMPLPRLPRPSSSLSQHPLRGRSKQHQHQPRPNITEGGDKDGLGIARIPTPPTPTPTPLRHHFTIPSPVPVVVNHTSSPILSASARVSPLPPDPHHPNLFWVGLSSSQNVVALVPCQG